MTSIAPPPGASSWAHAFTDPDLFGRTIRGGEAEVAVLGKGEFHAELTRVEFDRLWMQRSHETVARIAWARNAPARAAITFLTTIDHLPITDYGLDMSPGDLLFASPGATHHMRTSGRADWGAMSLACEDLAVTGRAVVGSELFAPAATSRLRPAPALLSRLLRLHHEAAELARTSPGTLAHPEVAHALEQKLLHAMIHCLADGPGVEASDGNLRHTAVLARLERLLAENCDRALFLAEICTTIGVAERTLRLCCQEQLGMGPIQYLWLRRMNLAHAALRRASSTTTTVTAVATGFGFWELGRFAVAHRALFGESPSKTLARTPQGTPAPKGGPFALAGTQPR
jgi:AraC-like DNA-binding protein